MTETSDPITDAYLAVKRMRDIFVLGDVDQDSEFYDLAVKSADFLDAALDWSVVS